MDVNDIFRKLSSGAKFNRTKPKVNTSSKNVIKQEPNVHINKKKNDHFKDDDVSEGNDVISLPSDMDNSPGEDSSNDEDDVVVNEKSGDDDDDDDDNSSGEDEESRPKKVDLIKNFRFKEVDEVKAGRKKKKIKKKIDLKQLEKEKIAEKRNKLRISVSGKRIPPPVESFDALSDEYQVSPVIVKNLALAGYKTPTPIQMQAFPLMLQGRQVLACAPTGSGKTAAFLVPILHHLKGPRKQGFRAVIVCPTRELATQTFRECMKLSEGTGLRINIISKISHAKEKFNPKSSKKFDILITTPNRLVYLLKQEPPMVELKNVEWLVVDESDKLFEAGIRGFRDQLAVIYNACDSTKIKRAMFSATQMPPLNKWCRKHLKNIVFVTVGIRNSAIDTVKQELAFVGNEAGKLVAFRDLVRKGLTPPVLVFVQSKERAQELFNELIYDAINVDVIHSDRTQKQRDNVIRSFREGKIWVLICTELMGRGIDFKGVNLVVNYDFPHSSVSYIHRIGRTGRAGHRGRAITFFTHEDTTNLRSVAHLIKASGGEVPSFMLTLKKPKKDEKKKLEKRAPLRDSISTEPVYAQEIERKKRNAIRRTKGEKRRKLLGLPEKKRKTDAGT